jgi:hypothetical protein
VEEQRELQNELDEVMEEIVHEVIIDNNEPITSMSDKTKRYTKENKQRALDGSIFLEEEKY